LRRDHWEELEGATLVGLVAAVAALDHNLSVRFAAGMGRRNRYIVMEPMEAVTC
jgi:hypothetical protein